MKIVYYNGKVYTGNLPLAEAFIVENGKFIDVGTNKEMKSLASCGDLLVDLDGKFVCSGFNDSHMHLLSYGSTLLSMKLTDHTTSLEELIKYMKGYVLEHPVKESSWLVGRGWNQDYFVDTNRMPNRYDLDKVSTSYPIVITRACGHCLVTNSKALELLNIDVDTSCPGGEIGIESGELDGRFFDNAMDIVYKAIPLPSKNEIRDMIYTACKKLNKFGITSCQSDDYCVYRDIPFETINEVYKELEKSGELTVRVYEQCNFVDLISLKEFVEKGNVTGVGTNLFKIGPLKMLGDGALGSYTAYLSRPYKDNPSTNGLLVFSKETMEEMISYANKNNMQVAVHAIGDACLDIVLFSIEKALKEYPRKDHRHGIVHCQITRSDQLKKIENLNLHVYAQSIFLDYDNQIVEKRVGKDLASTSYSWKTLMKNGVSVSNGSDCPVEVPDVLKGMQCGITRTSLHGGSPYLLREAFTVKEALDSFTINGAEASFEEKIKGKICKDMLADFVILGQNPFEADPFKIKDIPVLETYLAGKKVY